MNTLIVLIDTKGIWRILLKSEQRKKVSPAWEEGLLEAFTEFPWVKPHLTLVTPRLPSPRNA